LSCTYCTPKHLTNNEKNIETYFAYEDGDSDYGHIWMLLILILLFSLLKQMEALITLLIMRVLQNKSHIYVYMKNECLH